MIWALRPSPGTDGLRHTEFVDDRQHARHGRINKGNVRVGLGPEFGGCAGKELGFRGDLSVDFQANDQFPIFLGAVDDLWLRGFVAEIEHRKCPSYDRAAFKIATQWKQADLRRNRGVRGT